MNHKKISVSKMAKVLFFILLISYQAFAQDPGLPGGDPDVPDTPIDGSLCLFILVMLFLGIKKLNDLPS